MRSFEPRGQKLKTDGSIAVDRAFIAHFQIAAADAPAASAAGVLAATNLGAAAQAITTGTTSPVVPRALSIVGNVAGIAGNVVATGRNFAGEAITETMALNGNTNVNGAKAFRDVDSIDLPAQTHTPAQQQETITVTHGCDQDGYVEITVTAAGLGAASPKAVMVALTSVDNTVDEVAAKIRAALAADADVGGYFDVGGSAAAVVLTTKAYIADDSTLAIAMVDAPACGVTVGASGNTTAGVLGVPQAETIAVTAGSGGAGTLVFTVTATAIGDASPKSVNVDVTGDDDTTAEVATKVRAAIAADSDVSAAFTVSGADANIILTAKVKAANDATLALALADADGTGVTVGASGDTTAGVAPVLQKETISVTHQADSEGVIVVTVTATNMDNSPKAVNVDVDADDSTTALVAAKIRAALTADDDVGGFFTVSGSAAEINLTAKTDAANDATMAIALTDTPSTAVTVGASANTTAGVPQDAVSVGWNDKLGLPYKLAHNTVIQGMTFLNNTREAMEPTVTVSATAIELNTIDLSSALDGYVVDSYLVV
jgi:phage tail sheath gpL-like